MNIIYVLIPIAMLFVAIAVTIFFWAVKSEQFDDLDRQSVSILFDDDLKSTDASVGTQVKKNPIANTPPKDQP
jgi:cbb3-type cytochrome oxidase maturation protein